jgi:hypothetical protein
MNHYSGREWKEGKEREGERGRKVTTWLYNLYRNSKDL